MRYIATVTMALQWQLKGLAFRKLDCVINMYKYNKIHNILYSYAEHIQHIQWLNTKGMSFGDVHVDKTVIIILLFYLWIMWIEAKPWECCMWKISACKATMTRFIYHSLARVGDRTAFCAGSDFPVHFDIPGSGFSRAPPWDVMGSSPLLYSVF